MKFIDLFAGIGGFHYGLRDFADCVYANEWDKYANSVYRYHFGQCDDRDIRTVAAESIPDHDLLCAGFPCQSFSLSGKRKGFEDTRGTLFFDIARILKAKRPGLFVLENVKGLLTHDSGRTIKTIFAAIAELGYELQWQVCNSKYFGVPQDRERLYIVGNVRTGSRPEVFPIVDRTESNLEGAFVDLCFSKPKIMNQARTIQTRYYKGYSYHDGENSGLYRNGTIRRFTPLETERLQGFPDNWTKFGVRGEIISDTQRYKMVGNAVTTTVVAEIGRKICGK